MLEQKPDVVSHVFEVFPVPPCKFLDTTEVTTASNHIPSK